MRISFSPYNTKEDIDELIIYLSEGIGKLVKIK
jgi:selenocysteine lyase/cysteine desulfurase